jgi:hypothetical protein
MALMVLPGGSFHKFAADGSSSVMPYSPSDGANRRSCGADGAAGVGSAKDASDGLTGAASSGRPIADATAPSEF